ncbi:MAG: type II toxin-antitoxin system PemK/MazF family toxin [Leptospiraceae bacterium]|nr:type II toxin-antitoxin system PemK/MazF family toxin [Leptospiraceae bacterium]MCP5496375.1 type II toxin-antitoxin system PemK/MazF family toxin [Leptospiraceae bacterium]
MKEGDIILVDLGEIGKEVKGHELGKTRPCVIVKLLNQIQMAVVVPLSHGKPANLFTIVEIEQNFESTSNKPSYALCHQIRSISFNRVLKKLDTLNEKNYNSILLTILDFFQI